MHNYISLIKNLGLFLVLVTLSTRASAQTQKFKGQTSFNAMPTETRAIAEQRKGIFSDPDSLVYFSNDFAGGRLNGMAKVNDTLYDCLIAPENTPINTSPWYAFKIWSKSPQTLTVRLSYPGNIKHRYTPKISYDGVNWQPITGPDLQRDSTGKTCQFRVSISPDTVWVAAQEIITSTDINAWNQALGKKVPVEIETIGTSHQGRAIDVLKLGNTESKQVILLTGRQHPPEVTGHYALRAFVETLVSSDPLAEEFREHFAIYVLPLLNPDGVDGGFWRHNAGGIDLNRDWSAFNQPETRAVRDFLQQTLTPSRKLYFAIDFHSTYDDIYYTLSPKLTRNTAGVLSAWMDGIRKALPDYDPNIRANYSEPPTLTAFSYIYETYGAEALIYEIGDNTPQEFIEKKSSVAAKEMMKLLLLESQ